MKRSHLGNLYDLPLGRFIPFKGKKDRSEWTDGLRSIWAISEPIEAVGIIVLSGFGNGLDFIHQEVAKRRRRWILLTTLFRRIGIQRGQRKDDNEMVNCNDELLDAPPTNHERPSSLVLLYIYSYYFPLHNSMSSGKTLRKSSSSSSRCENFCNPTNRIFSSSTLSWFPRHKSPTICHLRIMRDG